MPSTVLYCLCLTWHQESTLFFSSWTQVNLHHILLFIFIDMLASKLHTVAQAAHRITMGGTNGSHDSRSNYVAVYVSRKRSIKEEQQARRGRKMSCRALWLRSLLKAIMTLLDSLIPRNLSLWHTVALFTSCRIFGLFWVTSMSFNEERLQIESQTVWSTRSPCRPALLICIFRQEQLVWQPLGFIFTQFQLSDQIPHIWNKNTSYISF